VALHIITAENDGDVGAGTVLSRLEARDPTSTVAPLPYPVHSDPEHKLLATPSDDFYVHCPWDAAKMFGAAFAGVTYEMVQPAFLVVDKSGAVVQKWSWKTMEPKPESFSEFTTVSASDGTRLKLIHCRPISEDILPSIREGREVKTAASMSFGRHMKGALVEMMGGRPTIFLMKGALVIACIAIVPALIKRSLRVRRAL